MEAFEEAVEELKKNGLQITYHSETEIKGYVNLDEDKSFLFTTIPYEEGWHVKVDGKETETVELADALLGIPITPGEHTVEMKFIPSGFVLGSGISGVCFVLLVLLAVYKPKKRKKPEPAEEVKEISQTENQENERTTDSSEENGREIREETS
jgi:uncharacterized membrane protein YfhO